jgi:hypothetical protein
MPSSQTFRSYTDFLLLQQECSNIIPEKPDRVCQCSAGPYVEIRVSKYCGINCFKNHLKEISDVLVERYVTRVLQEL